MDVWIIRDGEKVGPIHDFEVRRRISDGDLAPTTPAWHEGLEAWTTLVEIDLFRREFELISLPDELAPDEIPSEIPPASESPTQPAAQPQAPAKPCYLRRFWARWFDLTLYSGVWWLGMWAAGQDISAVLHNPWVMFLHYVPWFAIEVLLINYYGTTPGKWILGLHVVNGDGTPLDLGAATRRSLRVLFTGVGYGWGLLSVFCQVMSWFVAKRLGTTLWDHTGGHQVLSTPLQAWRVLIFGLLFFGALQMQLIVISPHMLEMAGETFPALKEQYKKSPPWHLPKNS